jgi:hypothetical protein
MMIVGALCLGLAFMAVDTIKDQDLLTAAAQNLSGQRSEQRQTIQALVAVGVILGVIGLAVTIFGGNTQQAPPPVEPPASDAVAQVYATPHEQPASAPPAATAGHGDPSVDLQPPQPPSGNDVAQRLRALQVLKDHGLISDDEYQLRRQHVLDRVS